MYSDNGFKSELFGCLEVPDSAGRRPRMLVIDVSPLLTQPTLEDLEIAVRRQVQRFAPEPVLGDRIAENLGTVVDVSGGLVRVSWSGDHAFNALRLQPLHQRTDVNLGSSQGLRIIEACAFNDAHERPV